MDYNGGPYDRDPYDGAAAGGEEAYSESAAPRGEPYGPSYGQSPYSASPYGQSPYGQSPYNVSYDSGEGQGGPYSRRYAQSGYGRGRGDEYAGEAGSYGQAGYDQGAYGQERRGPEHYGQTGGRVSREGYAPEGYGEPGYGEAGYAQGADRGQAGYDQGAYGQEPGYDQEGYDQGSYGGQGYAGPGGYGQEGYGQPDGAYGQDYARDARYGQAYPQDYGPEDMPYGRQDPYGGGNRAGAGNTGRMSMSDTARLRMQARQDMDYDADAEDFTEVYDDEYDDEPPRPKKKKKRSKVGRFFRGLGAYLAELPTKTLIIFGGSVAVLLVGVVLLVLLLPGAGNTGESDGQLALSDMSPTPSLPPTEEPVATPEYTPEPTPDPDPLNGVTLSKVGEEHDVVPAVQERLVELGYMEIPDGGYTTRYGPATRTAVRLFQIKNYTDNQQWDGILGAGTYNLLMSDQAEPLYLARGDGDDRTAEITRLVELVKQLQTRLISLGYLAAGSDTGRYGESTVTAVRTFQEYHGLDVDGRAGQATLTQIYASDAMDATTGAANNRSRITPTPDAAGAAATTSPEAAAAGTASTPDPATSTPTVNADGVVVY